MAEEILELGAVAYIERGATLRRIVQYIQDAVHRPIGHSPGGGLRMVPLSRASP